MSEGNGVAAARPALPAGTAPGLGHDIIKELRRPFLAGAVKPKIQTQGPKGSPPTWGQVVYYIDARSVIERLNHVVAGDWHPSREVVGKTAGGELEALCQLTVCGVTREDIGTGNDRKAAYSDALKRAAVNFGVGVSVYAMPKLFMHFGTGQEELRRNKKGDRLVIDGRAEQQLARHYQAWLDQHGIATYGEPLGHGDAVDAVGDFETGPSDDPVATQGAQQEAPAQGAAAQPQPAQAGGPMEPVNTGQAPQGAPASPQERQKTGDFARAAGLSLPTVKKLAELVCGDGIIDRLDEPQNKQLYETVVTAVQAGLGDAQVADMAAKALARPDRDATREAFLSWLCSQEEQAVAKTFGAGQAA